MISLVSPLGGLYVVWRMLTVVLTILVDYSGDVKSAKLQSATGVANEEVIEACKKAALKTNFNYNSDIGYDTKQSDTITYIFSAK